MFNLCIYYLFIYLFIFFICLLVNWRRCLIPILIYPISPKFWLHVPLRTRRALTIQTLYSNSILNGTSLNSINIVLALKWQYSSFYFSVTCKLHRNIAMGVHMPPPPPPKKKKKKKKKKSCWMWNKWPPPKKNKTTTNNKQLVHPHERARPPIPPTGKILAIHMYMYHWN